MPDPAATAQRVLHEHGISGIPALSLHTIAESEDILYSYCELSEVPELAGLLVFKGKEKGILVNTFDSRPVRHTFTFAHELGHFFLAHTPRPMQGGDSGFRCTKADITRSTRRQEREASAFAAALLMPESSFRLQMLGAPLDFDLITGLAREFQVSKQTCAYRVMDFSLTPCAIIYSEGLVVTSQKSSRAAGYSLPPFHTIPADTAAHIAISTQQGQSSFTECDPAKWLARFTPGTRLYECTRGRFTSGTAMTILRW